MPKPKYKDPSTLTDVEYLRDLADRLMHIPVIHGTDQDDIDRLLRIAKDTTELLSNAASALQAEGYPHDHELVAALYEAAK